MERDAQPAEIRQSALDFTPAYLPQGMTQVFEGGSVCRDEVISVVRNYGIASGGSAGLVVAHGLGEPYVTSDAYRKQLLETTVNGHRAVIVEPLVAGEPYYVHVRDGDTWWLFSGHYTTGETVRKFAEGIVQP